MFHVKHSDHVGIRAAGKGGPGLVVGVASKFEELPKKPAYRVDRRSYVPEKPLPSPFEGRSKTPYDVSRETVR